jgi:hypothetical protein
VLLADDVFKTDRPILTVEGGCHMSSSLMAHPGCEGLRKL